MLKNDLVKGLRLVDARRILSKDHSLKSTIRLWMVDFLNEQVERRIYSLDPSFLCSFLDKSIYLLGKDFYLENLRNNKKNSSLVAEAKEEKSNNFHGGSGNAGEVDHASKNERRSSKKTTKGGTGTSLNSEKSYDDKSRFMVDKDIKACQNKTLKDSKKKGKPVLSSTSCSDPENSPSKETVSPCDQLIKDVVLLLNKVLQDRENKLHKLKSLKETTSLKTKKITFFERDIKHSRSKKSYGSNDTSIFASLDRSKKHPTNQQVKRLHKYVTGFLPIAGDVPSKKVNVTKLLKVLFEKSGKINNAYEQYTKDDLFLLADVSGSCSSAAAETVKACEIIATTLTNVHILLHRNQYVVEGIINKKYFKVNKYITITEVIKKADVNCTTIIAFGDFDALKEYTLLAKKSKVILFDSYCANQCNPTSVTFFKKTNRCFLKGSSIPFTYVIGVNSLQKMLDFVK